MTAPFQPEAAQLLTQPHHQEVTATAHPPTGAPIPLDVEDFTVSWDEDRSPRVIAQLDCAVLASQTDLDRLDPRTGTRVTVVVTYRLPNGTPDSQQVADLSLRERVVDRPSNLMRLSAASIESVLVDHATSYIATDDAEPNVYPSGPVEALRDHVFGMAFPGPVSTSVQVDLRLVDREAEPYTQTSQSDLWQAAADAAATLDADLYDNGDRVLRATPRSYIAARSTLALTVGANGTVIDSAATLTREQWFSSVSLRFKFTPDDSSIAPTYIWGTAGLPVGSPIDTRVGGPRIFAESRVGKPTQRTADLIAASILSRSQARARSYRVSAVSAWWVRPGDTVTLQLPTGGQERLIASSLEHRTGGTMTAVLRVPDRVTPTGE